MLSKTKKVAFYTLGCKLNFSETSTIARSFSGEGFDRVDFNDKADIYVINTCSAHCRFCYREELIAKKEILREDGTVASKGLAKIPELVNYIVEHNKAVSENGGRHPETNREKLREILMSGDWFAILSFPFQH